MHEDGGGDAVNDGEENQQKRCEHGQNSTVLDEMQSANLPLRLLVTSHQEAQKRRSERL
jgi:hypothetical protein